MKILKLLALGIGLLVSFSAQAQEVSLADLQQANEQVKAKQRELNAKEQDLSAKEEQLKAMEADLVSREEELTNLRTEISKMLSDLSSESNKELDQLARLYGNTKAKSAASILIKTEVSKSAGILKRMTPMNAGKLMAEIAKQNPDYASELTSYMAGGEPPKP